MTSLLVLGAPNSGKTVLGAQLYGRARYATGLLKFRQQARDITILEHAFVSLQRGILPSRTSKATYGTIEMPLSRRTTGEDVDLIWPDYGGEKFTDILEARQLDSVWTERTSTADGLLLLIRPSATHVTHDVLTRPRTREAGTSGYDDSVPNSDESLAADSQYVEVLQLLTHAKGLHREQRFDWPLTIALTCWDEVDNRGLKPDAQLRQSLPLLWQYLRGAWAPQALRIVGVSALERPLANTEGTALDALPHDQPLHAPDATADEIRAAMLAVSDKTFRDKKPQNQGYLIRPDGARDTDLTLLIDDLLSRTHAS